MLMQIESAIDYLGVKALSKCYSPGIVTLDIYNFLYLSSE